MKNVIYILILFTGIISSCITDKTNSELPITADMIDPENPPVIEFTEMEYNFGKLALGATASYSFHFVNRGKSPLLIQSVKAACGCTVLKGWPKTPILPGEGGEIPIEYTAKTVGNHSKYISIIANTNPATTRLFLKAEVVGI